MIVDGEGHMHSKRWHLLLMLGTSFSRCGAVQCLQEACELPGSSRINVLTAGDQLGDLVRELEHHCPLLHLHDGHAEFEALGGIRWAHAHDVPGR